MSKSACLKIRDQLMFPVIPFWLFFLKKCTKNEKCSYNSVWNVGHSKKKFAYLIILEGNI